MPYNVEEDDAKWARAKADQLEKNARDLPLLSELVRRNPRAALRCILLAEAEKKIS